jgi:hypothetical protein
LNRFEDSNGFQDEEEDEDDTQPSETDGVMRSTRKKKAPREHV